MTAVTELDRQTLAHFHAALDRAVKERDPASFALLYTEDCVLLPPDGSVLRGRAEIAATFGSWVDAGFVEQAVETVIDLKVSGSVAVEEGISRGTFDTGAGLTSKRNNYLVSFVKGDDGIWLMDKDIWTSIPDEPAGRASY